MSKETDGYWQALDDYQTTLFNLRAAYSEMEDENETLKNKNELLKKTLNKILLKYEPDEKRRRAVRKEAGIVL